MALIRGELKKIKTEAANIISIGITLKTTLYSFSVLSVRFISDS